MLSPMKKLSYLRKQISSVPRNNQGRRNFPAQLRSEIIIYTQAQELSGVSIERSALSLDIAGSVIRRWMAKGSQTPKSPLLPVTFVMPPVSKWTVFGPAGLRLEEMSLAAVAELMVACDARQHS